jgi:hypothetical protein
MADLTRKELGDALQTIAEQFQAVDKSLAKIAVGFMALKGFVARQANPSAPKEALAQIQELEAELEKRDPTRAVREKTDEVIEVLKMIEKHGGPQQA